jgi:hypothetical protein
MTKTTRLVLTVLVAAMLLGGYVIVARSGSVVNDAPGDSPSGFLH